MLLPTVFFSIDGLLQKLEEGLNFNVSPTDLLDGFYFGNTGAPCKNSAFIQLDAGTLHLKSSMIELEDEPPADLETRGVKSTASS